jgi:hypothetical protein
MAFNAVLRIGTNAAHNGPHSAVRSEVCNEP